MKITRQQRRSIKRICEKPMTFFQNLGKVQLLGRDDRFNIFIDNGGSTLGVAHLDTVTETKCTFDGSNVFCPQLDDRLGVFALLEALPKLGCLPFDVLLTTDEERGASTASEFKPSKDYNWMFEFDRMGDSTVMYQYHDEESEALVEAYGWDVEHGSFTDICDLEHLGVKGFNFAVGYHRQHTKDCYADLNDTYASLRKFVKFHNDLLHTKLEHVDDGLAIDYYAPNKVQTFDTKWECGQCYEPLNEEWNFCPLCGSDQYVEAY